MYSPISGWHDLRTGMITPTTALESVQTLQCDSNKEEEHESFAETEALTPPSEAVLDAGHEQ